MKSLSATLAALCCTACALTAGCVTAPSYDYTAFRQSRPRSILVLPPVNTSTAVEASYSLLSQMTFPLAESGYYVMPVTLVDETFRQNGLANPAEIEKVSLAKLHDIFGADAALYVNITQYGTVYHLVASESVVSAEGRLVDLRSGALLWEGKASASSAENQTASGGLIELLVMAVVKQIVEQTTNASHNIASVTSSRLLGAGRPAGMLYGPRSANYEKE